MKNYYDLFSTCETVKLIRKNSIVHLNVDSIIILTFHDIFRSVVKVTQLIQICIYFIDMQYVLTKKRYQIR